MFSKEILKTQLQQYPSPNTLKCYIINCLYLSHLQNLTIKFIIK